MTELLTHSHKAIQTGSHSFAMAARLFPRTMRRDAHLLYAWCRFCDDLIDEQDHGRGTQPHTASLGDRMAWLEAETEQVLAGHNSDHPAFAALSAIMQRHPIPHRYPRDLLHGFRMDVENRRYATLDGTLTYGYRVAGTVGIMMAIIMGVNPNDQATLDRACDLGIAFQLTNIARDVMEDAEQGRIYVPLNWLERKAIPASSLLQPQYRTALYELAIELVAAAEPYYDSARLGLRALPPRAAMAISAALNIYRQIGLRICHQDVERWADRIYVPSWQKLQLAATGSLRGLLNSGRSATETPRGPIWTRPVDIH